MPRTPRTISSSGTYHVIFRGINKQNIFEEDGDKQKFLSILTKYKEVCSFELYAYCLMDNHIHLVIAEGSEILSDSIKRIGVSYVHWYNTKYERVGHLFQDRFKSEAILNDKQLIAVVRYVHQNPVKAGVSKDFDYKWSSYGEYIKYPRLVNTNMLLDQFSDNKTNAIEIFEQYTAESNENYSDASEYIRYNDSQAIEIIKQNTGLKSINELRQMSIKQRNLILSQIRTIHGISIRQVARITGFSVNVVAKAQGSPNTKE